MNGLVQQALSEDWQHLPEALRAHYQAGKSIEQGWMDIEYPKFMQWYLNLLRCFGALINRQGSHVATCVIKSDKGDKQYWQRQLRYADGHVVQFSSTLQRVGDNQLIEFVNPLLGLKMSVHKVGEQIHYRGISFVLKLGKWMIPIPESLLLGHTTIVEEAVDTKRFRMDFRLTHPWFGQLFRYSGEFETNPNAEPE